MRGCAGCEKRNLIKRRGSRGPTTGVVARLFASLGSPPSPGSPPGSRTIVPTKYSDDTRRTESESGHPARRAFPHDRARFRRDEGMDARGQGQRGRVDVQERRERATRGDGRARGRETNRIGERLRVTRKWRPFPPRGRYARHRRFSVSTILIPTQTTSTIPLRPLVHSRFNYAGARNFVISSWRTYDRSEAEVHGEILSSLMWEQRSVEYS